MKKRIVSMMLAAMVALSVVGCGSKTIVKRLCNGKAV